ncbi:MAG: hypothetical protein HYT16_01745 [DPANN group archaeon]|nr:hypothetical protein [DPANN group archaeon]
MTHSEIVEKYEKRLDSLLAYSLALDSSGRTLYEISRVEKQNIHPNYKNIKTFDRDVRTLASLGLISGRKEVILERLLQNIELLIAEDCDDVFSLTRAQLADLLCENSGRIAKYAPVIAEKLTKKYGKTPVFAVSQAVATKEHLTDIKREIREKYASLTKEYGIPPTVGELAIYFNVKKTTMYRIVEQMGLKSAGRGSDTKTTTYRRKLIDLERQLSQNNNHAVLLTDAQIAAQFPGEDTTRIRALMKKLSKERRLPNIADAKLSCAINYILGGMLTERAIYNAGIQPNHIRRTADLARSRLQTIVNSSDKKPLEAEALRQIIAAISLKARKLRI